MASRVGVPLTAAAAGAAVRHGDEAGTVVATGAPVAAGVALDGATEPAAFSPALAWSLLALKALTPDRPDRRAWTELIEPRSGTAAAAFSCVGAGARAADRLGTDAADDADDADGVLEWVAPTATTTATRTAAAAAPTTRPVDRDLPRLARDGSAGG